MPPLPHSSRKLVKISFANHPQSGERDGDTIRNLGLSGFFSDSVVDQDDQRHRSSQHNLWVNKDVYESRGSDLRLCKARPLLPANIA